MATVQGETKRQRAKRLAAMTKVEQAVELGKKTVDALKPEVAAARRQVGAFGQLMRENVPTRRTVEKGAGRVVRETIDAPDTARNAANRGRIEANASLRRIAEDAGVDAPSRAAAAFTPGPQDYRAATGGLRRRDAPPPSVSPDPPAPVQRGARLAPTPDAPNVATPGRITAGIARDFPPETHLGQQAAPRAPLGGATVGPDPNAVESMRGAASRGAEAVRNIPGPKHALDGQIAQAREAVRASGVEVNRGVDPATGRPRAAEAVRLTPEQRVHVARLAELEETKRTMQKAGAGIRNTMDSAGQAATRAQALTGSALPAGPGDRALAAAQEAATQPVRDAATRAGNAARTGAERIQSTASRMPGFDAISRGYRTAVDRSAAVLEAARGRRSTATPEALTQAQTETPPRAGATTGAAAGTTPTPTPEPKSTPDPKKGTPEKGPGWMRTTLNKALGRENKIKPNTGPGALRRGAQMVGGAVKGGLIGYAAEQLTGAGERRQAANATPESVNEFLTSGDPDLVIYDALESGRRALGGTGTGGTRGAAPNPIATEEGRAAGVAAMRRIAATTIDPAEKTRLTRQADAAEQSGVVGQGLRDINREAGPQIMVRAMENFPAIRRAALGFGDEVSRVVPGLLPPQDVAGARAVSPEGQAGVRPRIDPSSASRIRADTSPSTAPPPQPVVPRANTSGRPSVADADPDIQRITSQIQAGTNPANIPQNTGYIRNERTGEATFIDQRNGTSISRINAQGVTPANIPTSYRRSLGTATPQRISRQSGGGATLPYISPNNFAAGSILAGTNRMIERQQAQAAGPQGGSISRGQERYADITLKAKDLALKTAKFSSDQGKEYFDQMTNKDPRVSQAGFANVASRAAQGDTNALEAGRSALGSVLIGLSSSWFTGWLLGGRGPIDDITNIFYGKGDITQVRIDEATQEITAPRADGSNAVLGRVNQLDEMQESLLRILIAQGQ